MVYYKETQKKFWKQRQFLHTLPIGGQSDVGHRLGTVWGRQEAAEFEEQSSAE